MKLIIKVLIAVIINVAFIIGIAACKSVEPKPLISFNPKAGSLVTNPNSSVLKSTNDSSLSTYGTAESTPNGTKDNQNTPGKTEKRYIDIHGNIKFTTITNKYGGESPAAESLIKAFNQKYPNISVELDLIDINALKSSIDAKIDSGMIGDVFWIDGADLYKYAIEKQSCEALDPYINQLELDTSNVYKSIYNAGQLEGKLYMIVSEDNHQSLIYNSDALKETGLEPPRSGWSWEEFVDYCKYLTKTSDGGATYTQVGAWLDVSDQSIWMTFAQGWGGKLYDTSERKINFISDSRVYNGLVRLYSPMKDGYIQQIGLDEKYPNFTKGINSVFVNLNYTQLDDYIEMYKTNGIEWNLADFPIVKNHLVGTQTSGYVVSKNSSNKLAAAALCTFIYTEEGQRAYNKETNGSVPLIKNLPHEDFWEAKYSGKNYNVFVSNQEYDLVYKLSGRIPRQVSDILNQTLMAKIFTDALKEKAGLADGLRYAEVIANEKWRVLSK